MSLPLTSRPQPRRPRIGLALGGGSARGWSHIGVIRALEALGIRVDVVAGTSIGALVGAAYAAGELDRFEHWVTALTRKDVLSLMDFHLGSGVLKGARLMDFFHDYFEDRAIEDMELEFGATATVLQTGAEVWLREGSTLDAVRASIALPALFAPFQRGDDLLVDGGLVNPVPISLARAMEADIVIAVDLASDVLGRALGRPPPAPEPGNHWLHRLPAGLGSLWPAAAPGGPATPPLPSLLSVVSASIDIMQVRISRSRMAGDPPDVLVTPRMGHLGLLDFHLAGEGIAAGRRAVELARPALQAAGLVAE